MGCSFIIVSVTKREKLTLCWGVKMLKNMCFFSSLFTQIVSKKFTSDRVLSLIGSATSSG